MESQMKRDTNLIGDLTEIEVTRALLRSGRRLLKPLASSERYDIAIDNGDGSLTRVQCKTGVLSAGRIVFRVCSTDGRRPRGVPYVGFVDAFAIFCPQNGKSYLVPLSVVANCRTMSALRAVPRSTIRSVGFARLRSSRSLTSRRLRNRT